MAQYDLLLTQNTNAAGTTWDEKLVAGTRGGLITFGATSVPTTLAPGTSGYVLKSGGAGADLYWDVVAGGAHTQGTDTGTTSDSFTFDSDSVLGKIIIDPTAGAADLTLTLTNAALTSTSKTITFPNATGTVALTTDLHTQNSDTGTTSNTFTIDSDGTTGKIIFDADNAGGNYSTTIQNVTQGGAIVLSLPAVTGTLATEAYAQGLFAANDAMIFKGTIGTGGTHTIAAFNALTTYNAGWTYRVIEAGTIRGTALEIGDLVMVIVDRTGSGNVDADFTFAQTNLATLGSMAYETASNYILKSVYDANSILYATADNSPLALTVGASTRIGRKATGDIVALTSNEELSLLWASQVSMGTAPASKTATGSTGNIAFDANYMFICTASNVWKRVALATNW